MSNHSRDQELSGDMAERRALEMWRAREMRFPAFTRRMNPDAIDRSSGAWKRMLDAAQQDLGEQSK